MTTIAKNLHIRNKNFCIFISFLIPFFFGNFQYLTGTFVNFLLIHAALNFKKTDILPFIVLPFFGKILAMPICFSPFFLKMAPFIWISNAIFIFLFTKLKNQKLIISSFVKASILLLFSLALKGGSSIIFICMGILQFLAAFSGGFLAWFFYQKK